ncbi:MAG: LTA synthase family protein [Lachnospiraceae bacterium]
MMDRKQKIIAGIVGMTVCPIIYFYLLEAYTHNGFTEVRPWSQFFNIILFELVAWILFFLFRNVKWALRTEGIVAMTAGLANAYVYSFRSLPLVPWDIYSVKTAMSVADNYDFMPSVRYVVVVLGFVAIISAVRFFDLRLEKLKWYAGLAAAVVICIILSGVTHVLQQEDFQNRHRMYNKLFTPVYMWQVNGFALTMVMELPYISVDTPNGYDKNAAEEQLVAYEKKAKENDTQKKNQQNPNIIVIMDEAFSDLAILGDFQTNKDYMPYFHSMQGADNTISGYLNVSVCGGNTANTEFEFLTGNTMAFLPQGSVPYQQYVKHNIEALPSYLAGLGYETYGMHPYYASGWDRDTVYPLLGFEHTAFIEDYTDREYIRKYVSDRSCVEKIKETFEQKETGKPMFLFNVTMQNHGSYSDTYDNFIPDIAVEGASSESLSAYLSLIAKTDQALEELITYFKNVSEPTMIVFFGDHQPNDVVAEPVLRLNGKSSRNLSAEDTKLRYQVPYLIWANYEIDTKTKEDTSANYLGMKVLEEAGITLPAYQEFLKDFEKGYPILSAVRTEAASSPEISKNEYQTLQYYELFDKGD